LDEVAGATDAIACSRDGFFPATTFAFEVLYAPLSTIWLLALLGDQMAKRPLKTHRER